MEPLHVAHLLVLAMWLGGVITEILFEFAASDAESLRAAARGFCDTLFRTARKSLILNGEMSEWLKEHAWKAKWPRITERD